MNRGFTLLELLAVTTLLGLVASVLVTGLASGDEQAEFRRAVAELKEMDARARVYARIDGPLTLSVSRDGREVVLHGAAGRGSGGGNSSRSNGGILRQVTAPPGGRIALRTDRRVFSLTYDRAGRSADYTFEVDSPARRAEFAVSGISGWMSQEGRP